LPAIATLAVAVCMALLALQVADRSEALALRLALLLGLVLSAWPLSVLQRRLWRQDRSAWFAGGVLLIGCASMAMLANLLLAWHAGRIDVPESGLSWATLLRGRGWDAIGLPLLAQCALHTALQQAWARQAERERAQQAEALAREAELRALRYQLQPHFLFNTLNAVAALVAAQHGDQARELIGRLADYLRSTLEADARHEVSLAEELAHAADYLAIEQQRMGHRLQLSQHVAAGLLGVPTPRWLLQPLLENAVRHGVACRSEGGRIELNLRRVGEGVELDLTNDAPTMPAAEVATPGTGLGLRNVRARLETLYPGRHRLEAGMLPDGRFRVCVTWPAA
jgi:two-component system sensor histidine kinase AlgZ